MSKKDKSLFIIALLFLIIISQSYCFCKNKTLYVGLKHQLTYKSTPEDLISECTWEVSNENIATIDENGVITPKAEGNVTVKLKAKQNDSDDVYHYDYRNFEVKGHIFSFAQNTNIDDDEIKEKALSMMDWYYINKADELKEWIDNGNTCIFAFEGLGGNKGKTSTYHPNGFLKAMMVVTNGNKVEYVTRNASTLPDKRPDGIDKESDTKATTTLKPGIYSYYVGDHNSEYIALKPYNSQSSWYLSISDQTKFKTGSAGGINVHATHDHPSNSPNPFSAGCQTVYYEDYVDFGKAVGFLDKLKTYTTTLDINDGYGDYIIDLVGTKSSNSEVEFPDEVKYILDRSEDVNNGPTDAYPHGVFYPINNDGIEA